MGWTLSDIIFWRELQPHLMPCAKKKTPCHFRQISNFLFIPPPACQAPLQNEMSPNRWDRNFHDRVVRLVFCLSFRLMKVRDILPGCLLNCLSSLDPATHAPLRIFYADSPFPCCRALPRARSHRVRKRHIFDACFIARSRSHSCQFLLLRLYAASTDPAFPVGSRVC